MIRSFELQILWQFNVEQLERIIPIIGLFGVFEHDLPAMQFTGNRNIVRDHLLFFQINTIIISDRPVFR